MITCVCTIFKIKLHPKSVQIQLYVGRLHAQIFFSIIQLNKYLLKFFQIINYYYFFTGKPI